MIREEVHELTHVYQQAPLEDALKIWDKLLEVKPKYMEFGQFVMPIILSRFEKEINSGDCFIYKLRTNYSTELDLLKRLMEKTPRLVKSIEIEITIVIENLAAWYQAEKKHISIFFKQFPNIKLLYVLLFYFMPSDFSTLFQRICMRYIHLDHFVNLGLVLSSIHECQNIFVSKEFQTIIKEQQEIEHFVYGRKSFIVEAIKCLHEVQIPPKITRMIISDHFSPLNLASQSRFKTTLAACLDSIYGTTDNRGVRRSFVEVK